MKKRGLFPVLLVICMFLCSCAVVPFDENGAAPVPEQSLWEKTGIAARVSLWREKREDRRSARPEEQLQGETPVIRMEAKEGQETEPEREAPAAPAVVTVTVTAAGDTTLGKNQNMDSKTSFPASWKKHDPEWYLKKVQPFFAEDDFTVLNLEGPLTSAKTKMKTFFNHYSQEQTEKKLRYRGSPEYVSILSKGAVEAVSLGNNHSWDYGEEGLRQTENVLEMAGIQWAVNGELARFDVKGIRIGVVSVNEAAEETFDSFEQIDEWLRTGIETLRQDCNLVIACCHWGAEYEKLAGERQIRMGHNCIDWGADVVLGSHPQVIQGIERYQGKYIYYSLGNFCFGGSNKPKDTDCFLVQQRFTFINGEYQPNDAVTLIPCSITSSSEKNNYRPTPQSGEGAVKVIGKINERSESFGLRFDNEGHPVTEK